MKLGKLALVGLTAILAFGATACGSSTANGTSSTTASSATAESAADAFLREQIFGTSVIIGIKSGYCRLIFASIKACQKCFLRDRFIFKFIFRKEFINFLNNINIISCRFTLFINIGCRI